MGEKRVRTRSMMTMKLIDLATSPAKRNQERRGPFGEFQKAPNLTWSGEAQGDVKGQSVKSKKIREKRRNAVKDREKRQARARGAMAANHGGK